MSSPSWSERLFGGFRKTSERLAANLDEDGVAKPGLVEDVLDLVRALADGVRNARKEADK